MKLVITGPSADGTSTASNHQEVTDLVLNLLHQQLLIGIITERWRFTLDVEFSSDFVRLIHSGLNNPLLKMLLVNTAEKYFDTTDSFSEPFANHLDGNCFYVNSWSWKRSDQFETVEHKSRHKWFLVMSKFLHLPSYITCRGSYSYSISLLGVYEGFFTEKLIQAMEQKNEISY